MVTILSNQGKLSDHGGRVRSAAQQFKIPVSKWLDLSTGINPNSWPVPELPAGSWRRLPEPNDGLARVASVYYGCKSLLPVAGVQAAIQALPQLRSFSRVGIVWPGYSEHARSWKMTGDSVKLIPPNEVDESLASIDVLIIVNPNNPTGYYFDPKTLLLWHRYLVARGGWLIVDEGFIDATPHLSLARHCPRPGLIVLRSMSKFFGLAGLSVGVISLVLPSTPSQQEGVRVTGIWFSESDDAFYLTSGSVTEIPNLLIDFTANPGETVHFLYTGTAQLDTSLYLGQPAILQFQFHLDGSTVSQFTNLVTPDMSGDNFTVPITLAYPSDAISGLQHNLTVRVFSGANDAVVYKNKLLVQTFST